MPNDLRIGLTKSLELSTVYLKAGFNAIIFTLLIL